MFETNMDEYLDEEAESLKQVFDVICTGWDREVQYIHIFQLSLVILLPAVSTEGNTPPRATATATTALPYGPKSSPGQAECSCIIYIYSAAPCNYRSTDSGRGRHGDRRNVGDGWRAEVEGWECQHNAVWKR